VFFADIDEIHEDVVAELGVLKFFSFMIFCAGSGSKRKKFGNRSQSFGLARPRRMIAQ